MLTAKREQWVPVRRSNLKYYDSIELYYRNPYGKVMLYKPAGMKFSDARLEGKPYLGDLFVKPEDKLKALQEAQSGFSQNLTRTITQEGAERVKEELITIMGETLAEPRSGSLGAVPYTMNAVVDGFAKNPEIIKSLAMISHSDYSTAIHSINMMALTLGYCFYTCRNKQDTLLFGLSALLHDVGKTEIPTEILASPASLTEEQFAEIRRHPLLGEEILSAYDQQVAQAAVGAREHHEKLDGSGYPSGSREISEVGQVLSVIDCYEAITNDERPYRSAMRPIKALEMLKEETDRGRFNREVFEDFAYSLTDFTAASARKRYNRLFTG